MICATTTESACACLKHWNLESNNKDQTSILNKIKAFKNLHIYLNLQTFLCLHSLVNPLRPSPFLFNSSCQLRNFIYHEIIFLKRYQQKVFVYLLNENESHGMLQELLENSNLRYNLMHFNLIASWIVSPWQCTKVS